MDDLKIRFKDIDFDFVVANPHFIREGASAAFQNVREDGRVAFSIWLKRFDATVQSVAGISLSSRTWISSGNQLTLPDNGLKAVSRSNQVNSVDDDPSKLGYMEVQIQLQILEHIAQKGSLKTNGFQLDPLSDGAFHAIPGENDLDSR